MDNPLGKGLVVESVVQLRARRRGGDGLAHQQNPGDESGGAHATSSPPQGTAEAGRAYRKPGERAEGLLFAVLVALQLVPFWVVTTVPTTDGPSHVYNAFIQLHLGDPAYPQLGRAFALDPRPLPNWLSQVALTTMLKVVSPATAEKLLLSAYAVLFLAAARFFAGSVDPRRRWLSFLAFPFVLNWTLHFGFYNFCLSLAFYLLALGGWWRGRARPGPRRAAELTVLLLLCYFSHIVTVVLALFSLGVLWLATLPGAVRAGTWRRHLLHLAILAPQVVLPLWFVAVRGAEASAGTSSLREALADLAGLRALFTFGEPWLGISLAALVLGLTLFTLAGRLRREAGRLRWRWQEEDAFLVLAAALVAVYFLSPEDMSGGSLLQLRLTLFPVLVLMAWLGPLDGSGATAWLRRMVVATLAVLAVWNVANVVRAWRSLDGEVQAVLAAADRIAPGSRVLSLMFDLYSDLPGPVLLIHPFNRVDTAKGLVDWSNYEAASGVFPIRFQPWVRVPTLWEIQRAPDTIDIERFKAATDYVYCWRMPAGSLLARRLAQSYELVRQAGEARLYERRDRMAKEIVRK